MADDRFQQIGSPGSSGDHVPQTRLHMDEARYLPMVESLDIPEEQACELLQMIWNVLVIAADLGVGLDPVQMLMNAPLANYAEADENAVQQSSARQSTFKNAASGKEKR